jgi:DNA invertase Pin-like site-specific DNA recombinase
VAARCNAPGLERVHDALRSGDVLAVWRLDRLGRSLKHLIELMAELEAERVGFQSGSGSSGDSVSVRVLF